jgi:hypothetical protein
MPLASVVLWPATALFGVIAAHNVGVAATLALDGRCAFLWLRCRVRLQVAAWIGGLMMVLGPFAAARASAHLDLLLFFPVPLLFMAVKNAIRDTRKPLRSGALIGLLCAGQFFFLIEEIVALFAGGGGDPPHDRRGPLPPRRRRARPPIARALGAAVIVLHLLTASATTAPVALGETRAATESGTRSRA